MANHTKNKTDYLITLSEAKKHLRLDEDFTDQDAYLIQLIKAAVEFAEDYIEKAIATTTNTYVIRDFTGSIIEIAEGNVYSITSIQDGDSNDLTYADNEVQYYDSDFKVTLDEDVLTETDVTIIFQTGYTDSTLPFRVRQAILVKIADLYDHEGSSYQFASNKYGQAFERFMEFYAAKRVKYIRN